ncbi:MAG: hypothetical protein ACYC35_02415 [Pirellulales bacterium]
MKTATIRGTRKATVTFGEPIPIEGAKTRKEGAAALTRLLEERVQTLLGESIEPVDRPSAGQSSDSAS